MFLAKPCDYEAGQRVYHTPQPASYIDLPDYSYGVRRVRPTLNAADPRHTMCMDHAHPRKSVSWMGIAILVVVGAPAVVCAQTPAPLQEWQYSSGVALYKLYEPNTPEWQIETGLAVEPRPLYEGSRLYRVLLGPVIDVRYQDLAFASVGEGIGVNVIRGDNYRAGIAIGYDLGRDAKDDLDHLKGLGNVSAAPTVKLFGSYVISKSLPLVMRADVRQFAGGADGAVADFDLYAPLPGSSRQLVLFAGPSVTFADRLHLQTLFGVDSNQARASGYTDYQAHGGLESAGFGFAATRFIDEHWLVNMNIAANRLFGSAANSPITQARTQKVLVLAAAYKW